MINPIIIQYYAEKQSGAYDLTELEAIVAEYGEDYILNLIKKVCKKRHDRRHNVVWDEDWRQTSIKKAS